MAAEDRDLNRDPITDEPGAHPVGTGVGATGGAIAGAAAGTIGGPLGMAVGGVVGAVVGGLAGRAAAEAVNPTAEEDYWRENYSKEPYYEQGRSFDDYGPAYRHGLNARLEHEGDWDSAESRLSSEWERSRASSGLEWQQARPASRAAWDRVDALRGGPRSGAPGASAMGTTSGMGSPGTTGSGGSGATGSGMSGASMGTSSTRGVAGMGSDPTMTGSSDGMNRSMPMAGGTDMTAGSSMGMDQDIGGRSSDRGMGTTGAGAALGAGVVGGAALGGASGGMSQSQGFGSGSGMGSAGSTGSPAGSGSMASSAGTSRTSGGSTNMSGGTGTGSGTDTGVAGWVGGAQSAGNNSGDTKDVIDALQDLVECCKDGEHGFRECAEQATRQDLKSIFTQRAEDCRRGADELNREIRNLGGSAEDSGSTLGAVHRGWVAIKSTLTTYDDKAVLNEAERGEDNALARYRKALKQPLPSHIKQLVERQMQGVQRNHDQVKMLRDQA